MTTEIIITTPKKMEDLTLKELVSNYNAIVVELDDPLYGEVRKFRDKSTAISRLTTVQKAYSKGVRKAAKAEKPKAAKAEKPKATKAEKPTSKGKYNDDVVLTVCDSTCRPNTIKAAIINAIEGELCGTVGEVVTHIMEHYKKPRTGEPVNRPFVVATIRYFVEQDFSLNAEL